MVEMVRWLLPRNSCSTSSMMSIGKANKFIVIVVTLGRNRNGIHASKPRDGLAIDIIPRKHSLKELL